MHELFQALNVTVMEKLLLEVGARRFGGGTLWRCKPRVARCRDLHFAIGNGCKLSPRQIWIGRRSESASQEGAQPEIGERETFGIRGESGGIRSGLKVKGVSGILGQSKIRRAEAGEDRCYICGCSSVFAAQSGG